MSLQQRINSLKPYLLGVEFGDIPTAKIALPEGWGKTEHPQIQLGVISEPGSAGSVCAVYSEHENTTIDDILDYISELIRLNLEREEKTELFYTKLEELKKIFNDNSLENLKNLKFTIYKVTKGEFKLNLDESDVEDLSDFDDVSFDFAKKQETPPTTDDTVEEEPELEVVEEVKTDDPHRTIAVICSDYDDFVDWKHREGWGEYEGTKKQFSVGNTTYLAVKHPNDAKSYTIDDILATENSDKNPLKALIHSHLSMQKRDELDS